MSEFQILSTYYEFQILYLYRKLTDNIEVYVTTDYNMSKKSG